MAAPVPLEEKQRVAESTRSVSIGLPAAQNLGEHRFPLTPEGAAQLVARGFDVRMEHGAASHIHYSDEAYAACGVKIVERAEALGADIVIYLPPLTAADAAKIRRGGLLLTFRHLNPTDAPAIKVLLERHVIVLDLLEVSDPAGHRPFADILHEIDGRAAMAIASSLLADSVHGKGILLGGVAGVVPCEVVLIGSDMAAVAAGRSALGLGATVRIFDDNVYRLREALVALGSGVQGSTLHPRVFGNALRSADIVVATDTEPRCGIVNSDMAQTMKRGVICFDLTTNPGSAFPSMPVVDLDLASPSDTDPSVPVRLCYINAGNAVPRTVAMALSNTFATMLAEILVCEGVSNALRLNDGLRRAALLFMGKCVHPEAARLVGCRHTDINLFLQFS